MIDQHVHSYFSPDSSVKIEDYIELMNVYENEYLNLTDHLDCLDKLKKNDMYDYIEKMKNQYNYIKELNEEVYPGIEVGFNSTTLCQIKEFLNEYDYSLILLSIHDNDFEMIRYCFATSYDISTSQVTKLYFKQMYEAVTSGIDYDVLSHIGYIFRYTNNEVNPNDYLKDIKEILKVIVSENKVLEINTGCFRRGAYDAKTFYSNVLKIYKKLGGYKVSLGSDAHSLDDYCSMFNLAKNLLIENSFSEVTLIKNREHRQLNIK